MPELRKSKDIIIILIISSVILTVIFTVCSCENIFFNKNNKNNKNEDSSEIPVNFYDTGENIIETETDTYGDLINITGQSENFDISENPETSDESDEPFEPYQPPVKAKKVYQEKFDALRDKYNGSEDIVGIIKIPGTVVYYPVAQDEDNVFYLDHDLYKQKSRAGSIMLDYENDVTKSDPHTILYGHQMSAETKTMFHTLSYYKDEEFYKNHKYIIFNTIYENNVWEVFAFFQTHVDDFYYIKVNFKSERDFLNLAAEIKNRAIYDTGIDIKPGDRILTLSTCINQDPNTPYRYVLSARMLKNKDGIPADIAEQMLNAVEDFK